MMPMTDNPLPEVVNRLAVSGLNRSLGTLTHGSTHSFLYDKDAFAVSLTMNIRPDPYNSGSLHSVFSQNLPEGYIRRYISDKLLRFGKVNDMYLLALQGEDGIGILQYDAGIVLPEPEHITLNDILSWDQSTPLFPQLLETYYLRGMTSGVQPKVMVPAHPEQRTAVRQNKVIVKSFDDEYPLLTVNEYVCMNAAAACGLNPPKTWLSNNLENFVIERFDRQNDQRLAVEDFCVLMGKRGDQKYQSSYETLLKAVKLYTGQQQQMTEAYKLIVFNCLIGNGDAHLKNFALQYTPGKQDVRLCPPYDITNTLLYPTIDNKMALKLHKSKTFPDAKELISFAEKFDIQGPAMIIAELADGISDYINQSNEIQLLDGLKEAIEQALSNAKTGHYSTQGYRYDKRRKFE
ncbi:MAG: serine/threonine-protein kinase HipA [Phenylobacterium sp.]|jgi:serine/threonine-protein kinase HipA